MAVRLGFRPSDDLLGSYRELFYQSLEPGNRGEAGMVFQP
jgi:hypothetical protein